MTSLARRCDLIVALIDALLEEGEAGTPNKTCGLEPQVPARSDAAPPGGEPELGEGRVAGRI